MEKSQWQMASELSRFDDGGRADRRAREAAAVSQPQIANRVAAVPGAVDSVYDPQHPDADWAGLVPRDSLGRAHYRDAPAVRENVVRTEDGGITTGGAAPTYDRDDAEGAGRRGKRGYANDARFGSIDCASGPPLIAGPGAHNPSVHYTTASQQAHALQQRTQPDQLTASRQGHGKAHVVPQYEQQIQQYVAGQQRGGGGSGGYPGPYGGQAPPPGSMAARATFNPTQGGGGAGGGGGGTGNLVGFRSGALGGGSLLSNIGKSVARTEVGRSTPPPCHGSQGMLAGGGRKDMLKENFIGQSAIPGYTGVRRG